MFVGQSIVVGVFQQEVFFFRQSTPRRNSARGVAYRGGNEVGGKVTKDGRTET
jgi:hypothetical protein